MIADTSDDPAEGTEPLAHLARISFSDYLAMVRGLRLRFGHRRYVIVPIISLASIVLLAGPGDVWELIRTQPMHLFGDLRVILSLLAIFAFLPIGEWIIDHNLYYIYFRRQRNAGRSIRFSLDANAISWIVEGMSGRIEWTAVRRVIAHEHRMIFYIDSTAGVSVPRGDLRDEDWSKRVDFVLAHINATAAVVDARA